MGQITDRLQMSGDLGAIQMQLRHRLATRGYQDLRYFAVPGGFGMTTSLERVDASGEPARVNRWTVGKAGGASGWLDYLGGLISGNAGQFRLFAIVVTDKEIHPAGFAATENDVTRWRRGGDYALSPGRSAMAVAPGMRAWLLIYEFNGARSKGVNIIATDAAQLPFPRYVALAGLR